MFEEAGVAGVEDVDFAHHLTHDDFEVFVVDLHTLHAVNVLHLVDDVFLNGGRAHDVEDVGGSDGTVGEGCACADIVVLLDKNLFGQGHEILFGFAEFGSDGYFTVAAFHFAEGDFAVDFGNDSGIRGVAGLEKLGDTGKTTGDVAGAACGTRYLDEDFTGLDFGTVVEHEVGAHGESVGFEHLAIGVNDVGFGNLSLGTVFRLDDNLVFETGLFVEVDAVGDVLNEVLIFDAAADFADDNCVEGVPFADDVAFLDNVAVFEEEFRTVRDVGVGEHHACVGVHDTHFGETADNHLNVLSVRADFVGGNGAEFVDFEFTVVARGDRRNGSDVRSHTTDVECTEGELSTGLADRLGGDNADSFAALHEAVVGEVAAVALGADALLAFAGEH